MSKTRLHIRRSNDRVSIDRDDLEHPIFLSLAECADVASIAQDIQEQPSPKFPRAVGPQVVVYMDEKNGTTYVEHYDLDHWRRIENQYAGNRRTIESLANNCELSEGEYIVFPLAVAKRPVKKSVRKTP